MSYNLTLLGAAASGANLSEYGVTKFHPLGTLGMSHDGRWFRYSQAGAADLVPGNIVQRAAPIPNHLALTAAAAALGTTSITVTPGATAGAENLYAEGLLVVDTTPNLGYAYAISGHPAIVASTAFTLTLEDPVRDTAWTTSTRYGLHHNRFKNVIQTPTTITGPVVGGVVAPIPATQYGWLQTKGLFAALINGTPAVAAPVINSATTAGAVDVWTAAAQPTSALVGQMAQVGVSGKCNAIMLMLD